MGKDAWRRKSGLADANVLVSDKHLREALLRAGLRGLGCSQSVGQRQERTRGIVSGGFGGYCGWLGWRSCSSLAIGKVLVMLCIGVFCIVTYRRFEYNAFIISIDGNEYRMVTVSKFGIDVSRISRLAGRSFRSIELNPASAGK
jgi:hypothetical protein